MACLLKITVALLAILALNFNLECSATDAEIPKSHKALARLWARGQPFAAHLGDGNFTSHIQPAMSSGGRHYISVVLFIARAANYRCTHCVLVEREVQLLARSYQRSYGALLPLAGGKPSPAYLLASQQRGHHSPPPPPPVSFAIVDIDSARKVFHENNFQSVPKLFILPPTAGSNARGGGRLEALPEQYEVSLSPGQGAQRLADLLKERFSIKVLIHKDPTWVVVVGTLLALGWGLLGHFYFSRGSPYPRTLSMPWNKHMWMVACLGCYSFGVAGMVYCIIRNPNTHLPMPNGAVRLFSQGNQQYVYEGLTLSLVNLVGAVALYGVYLSITTAPPLMQSSPPAPLEENQKKSRVVGGGSLWWVVVVGVVWQVVRLFVALLCLAVFTMCLRQTYLAYTLKTRWYSGPGTLPEEFTAWLNASVKKNSGWVKRWLRMGQYWLFDHPAAPQPKDNTWMSWVSWQLDPNWPPLKRKAKVLIYGYAVRYPTILQAALMANIKYLMQVDLFAGVKYFMDWVSEVLQHF